MIKYNFDIGRSRRQSIRSKAEGQHAQLLAIKENRVSKIVRRADCTRRVVEVQLHRGSWKVQLVCQAFGRMEELVCRLNLWRMELFKYIKVCQDVPGSQGTH